MIYLHSLFIPDESVTYSFDHPEKALYLPSFLNGKCYEIVT